MKTWTRPLVLLMALALVAAACGDSDDSTSGATTAPPETTEATTTTEAATTTAPAQTTAPSETTETTEASTSLAGVCPSPLSVQTDWFPEAEHGALYNLIGDGYTVDTNNQIVRGPMIGHGGVDLGIDFEVRTGGPAIGFAPVSSYVYTDDSIHLAYANTESQVLRFNDTPLLSVVAPLDKNPQIIMWDPETYPDISTLADLGEAGVTINVFGGGVFADVFVAQGIWSADQVDPSYDGSPARFVSDGDIAQQGFASAEPYTYEFVFEDWAKPVEFQLLHDAGFEVYSQTISIRPDDKDELDACLRAVVPVIQQSVVDFAAAPDHAIGIIVDAVEQYASFWVYDEALANYSVQTMTELGLHSNGPDSTVGNMDLARVQGVIDLIADSGLDVPEGLTAEDLVTNEYIDPSIGF